MVTAHPISRRKLPAAAIVEKARVPPGQLPSFGFSVGIFISRTCFVLPPRLSCETAERNDVGPVQLCCSIKKECAMANNKNPNEKQPGENPEGKFHFNPGNMAGKKPGDPEQTAENRDETPPPEEKAVD
jgi:hypothetical protein